MRTRRGTASRPVTAGSERLRSLRRRDRSKAAARADQLSLQVLEARTLLSTLPDLVFTNASGAPSAVVGNSQTMTLSWTVKNQGGDIPGGAHWTDSVYLAPSKTFDPKVDIALDSVGHEVVLGLNSGNSYSVTDTVTVPNVPTSFLGSGAFLLFVTNDGTEFQESSTSNNVNSVAITLAASKVDLAVSNPTTSKSTAVAGNGDALTLSWTVKNNGTDIASAGRADEVFLANASTLAAATKKWDLGGVGLTSPSAQNHLSYGATQPPLGAGASVTESIQASLPNVPAGNYFLIYQVNAKTDQSETDAPTLANDATSLPITVTRPNVDLKVTGASLLNGASSTIIEGSQIALSYTAKNLGTGAANGAWTDAIYLSDTQTIGTGSNAVKIGTVSPPAGSMPLAAAGSYTNYASLAIPQSTTGARFLVIVANDGDLQAETDDGNDTNNIFAIPVTLKAPDLTVAFNSPPASVVEGARVPVTYTVTNNGTVPTVVGWQDTFYLSSSSTFDAKTATYLTSFETSNGITDLQPLAPGASYTKTVDLTLPQFATGGQFLFIVANSGVVNHASSSVISYFGQPETNLANNVASAAINVSAPDLQVVANGITAPTSAVEGSTIAVSYQVKNAGTVAAQADWTDAVYLSSSQKLDDTATLIATFDQSSNQPLVAGASYTNTEIVRIPATATGNRFLIFVTNIGGHSSYYILPDQGETDFSNNTASAPIALSAPDLKLVTGSGPSGSTPVTEGSKLVVSWTVKNNSATTTAPGPWYDAVYLSPTSKFDPATAVLVSSFNENGYANLAAGASYTDSRTVTIPATPLTNGFLIFVTNQYLVNGSISTQPSQGETDSTNNTFSVPITLNAPDLKVQSASGVSAGTPVVEGSKVNLSWTVKNISSAVPATGSWVDAIYLSSDPTFDRNFDTFLQSFTENSSPYGGPPASLAALASYTDNESVSIPAFATGSQFLIIVTNYFGGLGESDATNNTFVLPITLQAPDLKAVTASAPVTAVQGSSINVSWTAKNVSATVAAPGTWYDAVYLGDTPFFDPNNDTLINTFLENGSGPLAAGASYTESQKVTVPATAVGAQYLIFVVNTSTYQYSSNPHSQGETSYANNTFAVPITLTAPDPKITTATAPSSAVENSTISVSWTVKNNGTVATATTWYDAVYIGDSPTFDPQNDILIDRFDESGHLPLQAGKTYTETQDITIPATAVGKQYLIFVTDVGQNSYYYSGNLAHPQGETDLTNDTFSLPITLTAPDLKLVPTPSAPATMVEGGTYTVSWQVQNISATVAALGEWSDAVYLSNSSNFDPSTAQRIDVFDETAHTNLQPNASYTDSEQITIPSTAAGTRYLIFVTNVDSGYYNSVSHPQGETSFGNNWYAIPIQLKAPDLIVKTATAPASGVEGSSIQISWTVQNVGNAAAPGEWTDAIYLSSTPNYDSANATFITSFNESSHSGLSNASGSNSYTDTQNITIPAAPVGTQYLIFVTNPYSGDQPELNSGNNWFAVPISLTAPDLKLQSASGVSAATPVVEGSSVKVSWTVTNASATVPAYASWYDAIYIDSSPTFNPITATLVNSFSENSPNYGGPAKVLQPGQSYTDSQNITIPAVPLTDGYLFFVTNVNPYSYGGSTHPQGETDYSNNVFSLPIKLIAPDLTITTASGPPTTAPVVEGQTYSVSWTVKNLSSTVPAPASWYDAIYISDTPTLDLSTATFVQSFTENQSPFGAINPGLQPGQSYSDTKDIVIPATATGKRYLIFVTDASYYNYSSITHPQGQTDYTNDTFALPITVAAPDLKLLPTATAPTSAVEGSQVKVTWSTQNIGTVPAAAHWSDAVYLSTSPTFDSSATFITSFTEQSHAPLQPGASYSDSQNITIPATATTGQYYLIFVANSSQAQPETDRTNNTYALPITLSAPDLKLQSATGPTASPVIEGSSVSVSWAVKNIGTVAAPRSWTDAIYLSSTPNFDRNSAKLVTSFTENTASGGLAAGGSYTDTKNITIPAFTTGTAYLIFVTNYNTFGSGVSAHSQGETDYTNDTFPVQITLAAPDLTVSKITAPAPNSKLALGESATISWQVTNVGAVAAPSTWTDQVWISDTNQIDDSAEQLASKPAGLTSGLAAGANYAPSVNVAIPQTITPGNRFLIVRTNTGNAQPEIDNINGGTPANDLLAIPITITAPDLIVTTATVTPTSAEVGNGQSVTINYTVKNNGTGAALGTWNDAIYIGPTATFDPDLDTLLTTVYEYARSGLAVNGTYSESQQVTIPDIAPGVNNIFVVTNYSTYYTSQGETNSANNATKTTQSITLSEPKVDLSISNESVPTTLNSNQPSVPISFTVTNNGTEDAGAYWSDKVYLSPTPTFSSSNNNILLASYGAYYSPDFPLAAGDHYDVTTTADLPSLAPGTYYVIFQVNADPGQYGQGQGESDAANDTNNTFVKTVTVAAPDLAVTAVSIQGNPTTLVVNNTYTINWTVKNVGTVAAQGDWSDAIGISFSSNSLGYSVKSVDESSHSPLNPGQTYQGSTTITLTKGSSYYGGSLPIGGQLFLVVEANSNNGQGESNTANNFGSVGVAVTTPAADLKVSQPSGPASGTASLGQQIQVSWTVNNVGQDPANGTWSDAVYLSSTPTLDGSSILLGTFNESSHSGLVTTAGSNGYTDTQAVTIPAAPLGKNYLVIVTNVFGTQSESNTTNNTNSVAITLSSPNLVVQNVNADASVSPGQTIPIGWVVKNQGNAATIHGWNDLLYLSDDQTLSGDDTYLGAATITSPTNPLAAGATYSTSLNVTIPASITGPRFILVVPDGDNGQPQSVGPNVFAKAITINPEPDLTVQSVAISANPTFGKQATVTWKDVNTGDGSTVGSWTDTVYLSTKASLDATAVNLGSIGSAAVGTLASGASGNQSLTVNLPLLANYPAGSYFIIVQTNSGSTVVETSFGNNTGSASASFAVFAPDLDASAIGGFPTSAQTLQVVSVSWTDTNNGNVDVSAGWNDSVYASPDGKLGDAILLGTFGTDGPLKVGASVARTQLVTLPSTPGVFTILVVTNSDGAINEGPNVTDDTAASANKITVVQEPLPDLIVTSITPPPNGSFAGQTVPISFTIKNQGVGGTTVPIWNDFVVLSQDPNLTYAGAFNPTGPGSDQLLNNQPVIAEFHNPSYLAPGQSYANTVDVTLPANASGTWYAYVFPNGLGFHYRPALTESTRANNLLISKAFNAQLPPTPDLTVSSVISPAQAFSGQPMNLSWTVVNNGQGGTGVSDWEDEVFMSPNATFDSSAKLLTTFTHSGALVPGDSYTDNKTVTLPVGVSGKFYFFVETNADGAVFENGADANNIRAAASTTTVNLTPPPDLQVDSVTTTTTSPLAGHPITINYKVENAGSTATPNTSWTDSFFLSPTATLDSKTAIALGNAAHSGALAVGGSYTGAATLTIPNGVSGSYFLILQTDSGNVVFEANKTNDVGHSTAAIAIQSRPADLIVSSASTTATGTLPVGISIPVTWTVKNQGTGDTIVGSWTDNVYITAGTAFTNPVLLGTFPHSGLLNAGGSYSNTQPVKIPASLTTGTYDIWVQTNAPGFASYQIGTIVSVSGAGNGPVVESNTQNDFSTPFAVGVNQKLADLQASKVTPSGASFQAGTSFTVTWTETNAGTGASDTNFWYDDIWLSTSNTLGGGGTQIYLGSASHAGVLGAGQSYNGSVGLKLPQTLAPGSYFVIVAADRPISTPNDNGDFDNQVFESNESNNQAASTAVAITASASPDLTALGVTATPSPINAGQQLTVKWTDKNLDSATTAKWYDTVFLSLDGALDPSSDIYLGFANGPAGLGSGQTFAQSATFSIPQGVSGNYYVLVDTNGNVGNPVYENGRTANNVAATAQPITINLPLPVNLVAGTITIPANAVVGQPMQVTYKVTNSSANVADGAWTDSLYLSTTTQWSFTDPLLGTVDVSGPIAAGASYTKTVTFNVPGIAPGTYNVILRTNVLNQLNETSLGDNLSASVTGSKLDAAALALNTPTTFSASSRQSVFYKVNVPAGHTLQFTLKADQANLATASNELYVSYGTVPSRLTADYRYSIPFNANQSISIPTTQAGSYYVLVYADSVANSSESLTLTAADVPFSVQSVSPAKVGNAGSSTIQINGALFDRGTTFSLLAPGGATIPASATSIQDASTAFVTFNLAGAATGAYTVVATPATGTPVKLTGGLAVQAGTGANVQTNLVGAPFFLPDRVTAISLNFSNMGDADAGAPLIFINSKTNMKIGLSPTFLGSNGNLVFLAFSQDGPAGTLRPGTSQSMTIYVQSVPFGPTNNVVTLSPVGSNDPNPIDWNEVLSWIPNAPAQTPNWSAVYAQLQKQIGSTWGDYVKMLDRNASLFVQQKGGTSVGFSPSNQIWLLSMELDKAIAAVGTSLSGNLSAQSLATPIAGRVVYASLAGGLFPSQAFTTRTLNDGSFVFPTLPAGTYTLSVDGEIVTNAATVTVKPNQAVTGFSLNVSLGMSIKGQVLQAGTSKPIGRAFVTAINQSDGSSAKTTTDALGNYAFTALKPGVYDVLVDADGFARTTANGINVSTSNGTQTLTLAKEAVVQGKISLPSNGPAETMLTVVARLVGGNSARTTYSTQTSTNTFSLGGLPAGTYDITLNLPGYVGALVPAVKVAAGGSVSIGTTALVPAATVSGSVTSSDPLTPSAQLLIGLLDVADKIVATTTTDASGNFTFDNLPAGSFTIAPLSPNAIATPIAVTLTAGQKLSNQKLQLLPGATIQGTVTNPTTQTPTTGVPVFLTEPDGSVQSTVTDSTGAYQFAGLGTGAYTVSLAPGAAAAQAVSVVAANLNGGTVSANFQYSPASQLTGALIDGAGNPVAGGTVSLYQNGVLVGATNSANDGTFSFLMAATGTFDIQASAPGLTFPAIKGVVVSQGANIVTKIRAGNNTLTVNVTTGSTATAGAVVNLFQSTAGGWLYVSTASTGSTGQVSFPGLALGTYRVIVTGPSNTGAVQSITLTKTATVSVAIAQEGTLAGTITDSSNKPIAGASIELDSQSNTTLRYFATSASDGTYSLANLPNGAYTITASAGGFQPATQTVTVGQGTTQSLKLSPAATSVTGTLIDLSNFPVPGATINVVTSAGVVVGQGVTDSKGDFTIATGGVTNLHIEGDVVGLHFTFPTPFSIPATGSTVVQLGVLKLSSNPVVGIVATQLASLYKQVKASLPVLTAQAWLENLWYHSGGAIVLPSGFPIYDCPDCDEALEAVEDAYDELKDSAGKVIEAFAAMEALVKDARTEFAAAGQAFLKEFDALVIVLYKAAVAQYQAYGPNRLYQDTVKQLKAAIATIATALANVENAGANAVTNDDAEAAVLGALGSFDAARQKVAAMVQSVVTQWRTFEAQTLQRGASTSIEATITLINKSSAFLATDPFAKVRSDLPEILGKVHDLFSAFDDFVDDLASFYAAEEDYLACYEAAVANGNCPPNPNPPPPPRNPPPPTPPPHGEVKTYTTPPRTPNDPNALIGPEGFGDQHFVAVNAKLPYEIEFENEAGAAPAQQVTITEQLSPNLDWRTFRLGNFGFRGTIYTVASNTAFLQQTIDFTDQYGFVVQVAASVDVQTGIATWTFTTIDPATGQAPADPTKGLLPPNDADGNGQGFVTYTISPKSSDQTGAVINALATIIFDTQPPIDTNQVSNTVSTLGPGVTVTPPPALITNTTTFSFSWTGADVAGSPAVAAYNVYVAEDGGAFTPFLQNTTQLSTSFTGESYHTYKFYVVALDNAGVAGQPSPTFQVALMPKPTTPTAPTLLPADDTGKLGDGVTDLARPRITGIAVANATIQVFDSTNKSLGTTTSDATGSYVFQLPTALKTGTYKFYVVASNVSGKSTASPMLTLQVVPVPAAITPAPILLAADDSGKQGDHITDIVSPRLTGPAGTTIPGGTVQVLDQDGNVVASGKAGLKGGYTVKIPGPLAPASYQFQVRLVDSFANPGASSKPLALTIVAAPAPLAAPTLLPSDSNGAPNGQTTTLKNPHLTGTAPVGTSVRLVNKAGTVLDTKPVAADGTYIVQVKGPLAVGSYQFYVQDVDQYGDSSAASPLRTITVVTPPQGGPKVTKTVANQTNGSISTISVTFSAAMNPTSLATLTDYVLLDAGKDHRFGTSDDRTITISKEAYTASTKTATLTLKTSVPATDSLKLTINAQPPSGLKGANGKFLNSSPSGVLGANYVTFLGAPAKLKQVTAAAHTAPSADTPIQASVIDLILETAAKKFKGF